MKITINTITKYIISATLILTAVGAFTGVNPIITGAIAGSAGTLLIGVTIREARK